MIRVRTLGQAGAGVLEAAARHRRQVEAADSAGEGRRVVAEIELEDVAAAVPVEVSHDGTAAADDLQGRLPEDFGGAVAQAALAVAQDDIGGGRGGAGADLGDDREVGAAVTVEVARLELRQSGVRGEGELERAGTAEVAHELRAQDDRIVRPCADEFDLFDAAQDVGAAVAVGEALDDREGIAGRVVMHLGRRRFLEVVAHGIEAGAALDQVAASAAVEVFVGGAAAQDVVMARALHDLDADQAVDGAESVLGAACAEVDDHAARRAPVRGRRIGSACDDLVVAGAADGQAGGDDDAVVAFQAVDRSCGKPLLFLVDDVVIRRSSEVHVRPVAMSCKNASICDRQRRATSGPGVVSRSQPARAPPGRRSGARHPRSRRR